MSRRVAETSRIQFRAATSSDTVWTTALSFIPIEFQGELSALKVLHSL